MLALEGPYLHTPISLTFQVLGVMDVVPLLGKEFNIYFPIVLLILIVMNLFSVWCKYTSLLFFSLSLALLFQCSANSISVVAESIDPCVVLRMIFAF